MIVTLYAMSLVFTFAIVVLLRFYSHEQIILIGDFLKKVLPRIPMTDIAKVLKRKRKGSGKSKKD